MFIFDYIKRFGVLVLLSVEMILILNLYLSKATVIEEEKNIDEKIVDIAEEVPKEPEFYYIDIKGAVKKPGVYKLEKGSIVNDVIKLAGGLKINGTTSNINLSKEITNQMVIIISTKEQLKKEEKVEIKECIEKEIIIEKCENSPIIETNTSSQIENTTNTTKISINKGTIEELMTLPGVGESKAKAIIEYRTQNGAFNSIEEIKNVSGIGDSAFEKLKEYISI